MTASELRAVFALAGIFAMRMMGLFMIMPVIALYGRQLSAATPGRIGLAVGIYGLTQALLQIPIGRWSDRTPRKPVIVAGLLLFVLGAVVAALSTSIWGVIAGRALQGSGAISAVALALLADLTREEQRTKAMAVVGMTIGLSFALAFILGPLIAGQWGLSGLFWATAAMALAGVFLAIWVVPSPHVQPHADPTRRLVPLTRILLHPELARLNFGVFTLHLVMAASWLLVPAWLVHAHLPVAHHARVYLPVMLLAFVAVVPFIVVAEKRRRMKQMFAMAVATMLVSLLWLAAWHASLVGIVSGLFLYFMAFNLLEALLPSLVSKISPAGTKGAAMGIYSTWQFMGPAIGGTLGGVLLGAQMSGTGLVLLGAVVVAIWLVLVADMRQPPYLNNAILHLLPTQHVDPQRLQEELLQVAGIVEVALAIEDGVVYLKADKERLTEAGMSALPGSLVWV